MAFLKNAMELVGRTQAELADILGSRSNASEILNGHRPMSLDNIRKIAQAWKLPTDALVGVSDDRRVAAG